jgi:phosphoribosylanthranilate isomerase
MTAPDRANSLRNGPDEHGRFGLPVIKAIAVADASDLANPSPYEQVADMLLFDAKPAQGSDRSGGHGTPFDWQILRGRKFPRPWLLAGGLDAENVGRALRICDAPGVDTASGVETAPGVKNPGLIAEFVQAARNAKLAEGAEI